MIKEEEEEEEKRGEKSYLNRLQKFDGDVFFFHIHNPNRALANARHCGLLAQIVQISPDVTVSHVRNRLQINVRGKAHVLYHRAHTHKSE